MKKILLLITIVLILICSNVFASTVELDEFVENFDQMTEEEKTFLKSSAYYTQAKAANISYENIVIALDKNSTGYTIYFGFTNNDSQNAYISPGGDVQLENIEAYWITNKKGYAQGKQTYMYLSNMKYLYSDIIVPNYTYSGQAIVSGFEYGSTTITDIKNDVELPGSGETGNFPATLPEIVATSHPEEVLLEVVTLLPIVMIVVVFYLGLRKALEVLSNILHNS